MANVVDQLLSQLQEHPGIEIEMGGSGHWRVTKEGRFVTMVPGSPSDHRTLQNVTAEVRRRAGIDLSNRSLRSGRPKRHKRRAPQPTYSKRSAAAAVDELRQELMELGKALRSGDRDPAYYQRIHELVCQARREIEHLT